MISDFGKAQTSETPSIVVTGAAGFIGRNLLKSLNQEADILCLYRKHLPDEYQNVNSVYADLNAKEQLIGFLRNRNTVVHLAWEKSFLGAYDSKIRLKSPPSENISVLRNLISAMEYGGVRRIIFVSCVGAAKEARTQFLREKYQAEHEILNSQIPEKIIIRASVLFDDSVKGGTFANSLRRLMTLPGFYPIPRRKNTMSPLHVDDLCSVIRKSIFQSLANNEAAILNVVGKEEFSVDEVLKIVSDNLQEYRIPLGSVLGDIIISFIERHAEKKSECIPRIKSMFDPINIRNESLVDKNPLAGVLPDHMKSFREHLFHLRDR